jgi:hypothetical protein
MTRQKRRRPYRLPTTEHIVTLSRFGRRPKTINEKFGVKRLPILEFFV